MYCVHRLCVHSALQELASKPNTIHAKNAYKIFRLKRREASTFLSLFVNYFKLFLLIAFLNWREFYLDYSLLYLVYAIIYTYTVHVLHAKCILC